MARGDGRRKKAVTQRAYDPAVDFAGVSDLLLEHLRPGNREGNWLQPAWEYMHTHPMLDEASLGQIGVWEQGSRIVAVAHYESVLSEAFFQVHPELSSRPQRPRRGGAGVAAPLAAFSSHPAIS